jgi:energy-coupling factor transporter transmembrane protein EcfT
LRSAENLGRALEARAFGAPGRRRSVRRGLHFRPVDGLALAAMIGVFGGVIAARILWGFGTGPLF